jgi:hypothetical protein
MAVIRTAQQRKGGALTGPAKEWQSLAWHRVAKAKNSKENEYNHLKGETNMTRLKVRLTTLEGMLGTSPSNPTIYEDFIGKNAPDAASLTEEIEALGVEAVAEKGTTIFPKLEDGTPFMWDYQIKGLFKDACGMLSRLTGKDPETGKKRKAVNESSKITAFKKAIDGLIFVQPRKIPIQFDGEIGFCQRPLRAQTMQGERVSLAKSEEVPAGAVLEFDVVCLDDSHVAAVKEWLDYGALRGLGQWRNSGKGRFTWEEIKE